MFLITVYCLFLFKCLNSKHFVVDTEERHFLVDTEDTSDQSNTMLTGDVRDKVAMGVANDNCDTGAKMLEVDWLDDPAMYKCQNIDRWGGSGYKTDYIVECDDVPKDHSPKHFCMNDTISYDSKIPTYGDHRPIWPMFGEYKYNC